MIKHFLFWQCSWFSMERYMKCFSAMTGYVLSLFCLILINQTLRETLQFENSVKPVQPFFISLCRAQIWSILVYYETKKWKFFNLVPILGICPDGLLNFKQIFTFHYDFQFQNNPFCISFTKYSGMNRERWGFTGEESTQ